MQKGIFITGKLLLGAVTSSELDVVACGHDVERSCEACRAAGDDSEAKGAGGLVVISALRAKRS